MARVPDHLASGWGEGQDTLKMSVSNEPAYHVPKGDVSQLKVIDRSFLRDVFATRALNVNALLPEFSSTGSGSLALFSVRESGVPALGRLLPCMTFPLTTTSCSKLVPI